jgi:hypothetical protein
MSSFGTSSLSFHFTSQKILVSLFSPTECASNEAVSRKRPDWRGRNTLFYKQRRYFKYSIRACISRKRVLAASRFLGQEFGNNNSYISRTRLNLCESKIFAIAFAALWLSLAAFTVICQ